MEKEFYECITCIETLEHIPDENVCDVISHIYRLLKPGGTAYICVPSINRPKEKKHFRHYDIQTFIDEINESKAQFKTIDFKYLWKKDAMKRYLFFTANGVAYIRCRLLDNLIWRQSIKANKKNGAHILAILKK